MENKTKKKIEMRIKKSYLITAVQWTLVSVLVIGLIFIGTTFLWIGLTPYTFAQFNRVLSLCIKNAGTYSTLLVGIVVTIFWQIYSKEKEIEKDEKAKIKEIGYYTLCFPLKEYGYKEKFVGDKMVIEIRGEEDYVQKQVEEKRKTLRVPIKFLTSKKESTNLKNIMAFSEEYFNTQKNEIINDYYSYCEKVEYNSPLYCATKPTSENLECSDENRKRYFWLFLNLGNKANKDKKDNEDKREGKKNIWITAVTEEGFLLFIKIKIEYMDTVQEQKISLLQQTTYYKSGGGIVPLYR